MTTAKAAHLVALDIPVAFTHSWTTTSGNINPPHRHALDRDLTGAL
ncbi:hypothetical protein ACIHCX_26490 [Streptomyces sp. NPDC052043]